MKERDLFHDPRPKPRDYQTLAVESLHSVLQSDGKVLGELATGTGKTLVAAMLSERYKRALVIDPRIVLCSQNAKAIEAYRLREVEVEQENLYANPSAPVVVASLQSLLTGDRGKKFSPDVVIVDEAHYGAGAPTLDLLDYYRSKGAVVCGLTATPHARPDGSSILRYYGRCPVQYGVAPAIAHGHLVPISAKRVVLKSFDLSRIKGGIGDFDAAAVERIMAQEAVVQEQAALVVANHKKRGAVYCQSVKGAIALRTLIETRHGVPAALIHSRMSITEREAELKRYESGEASLIINVAILTMGWDAPVEELHLLAPTRSLPRYMQVVGRALRPDKRDNIDAQPTEYLRRLAIAQGHKPHARIIDYTDTTKYHRICSAIDIVLPPAKVEKYREKLLKRTEEGEVELSEIDATIREQERMEKERALAEMEAEKDRRRQLVAGVTFDAHTVDPFAKPTAASPARREARMLWGPYKGQPVRLIPPSDLRRILRSMKRSPGSEWLATAIKRELDKREPATA